jgi:iron complex outermembrane receptor protein
MVSELISTFQFFKMLLRKAALAGFCLSLAAVGVQAQDCHFALRGHVTEAGTGEPLAYATVFVREAGKGSATDERGYFAIPNLCEKTAYTVELSHVECAHLTQMVRLTENALVEFQLQHDAVLHEVVVVEKASAPPPTQATLAVEKAELEAAKGINLGETLKKLPGVSTLNTGTTIAKPIIQGLHSNRIAIVNNGVALEGQQWGSEHAPEIDPFTAERVSVLKGAAGVRYGPGAMGGVVLLEPAPLRSEVGWGGWLSLGGFSNGLGGVVSGAADWKWKDKPLAIRLQGTAKRTGNLRAPDYWLGNTGTSELNFSAMARWQKGRWTQEASVSRFDQTLGILRAAHIGSVADLEQSIAGGSPRNNVNERGYFIDRPKQKIEHSTAKYRATLRLSEHWKLTQQYAWQYNYRREYDRVRSSTASTEKPQTAFRIWTNVADVALEHLPRRHWEGGVGVQALHQLNFVDKSAFIPDYQSFGGSVWAFERWRRFPNPWEFEAGVRYDYRRTRASSEKLADTVLTFGNASGTLGAVYHFTKNLSAKINSGYAWRPPHLNELFARGVHHGAAIFEQGNAALQSEKAWNSNLTLDWQGRRAAATLTLYRNQIRDFIYLNPVPDSVTWTRRGPFPFYRYEQADAILRGLDGLFSAFLFKNIEFEGRVSLLRGQRMGRDSANGEASEGRRDWLPLMPTDRLQYGLKWSRGAGATFVRAYASTSLRQTRIPAQGLWMAAPATFTTLGLEAGHTLGLTFPKGKKRLEIGLSIQNLANVRYREYLDFFRFYADAPGVDVRLRAKMAF